ncbi:Pre-mRNA-splicing factor SPF27 [Durotheca rogersii]|uniref:Pre-mRNA-splicing factor SPF27 n=1 Tax=Durotheca rogersii TaxID=419775 RepID=UPI00221F6579|nr:Pre-mRNA-splicing factor SPF27 [Durotheca rogersii]KAI5860313.1 Pre-mRNA-splicing factor SPF27 [Durotheca rogersii]
MASSIRTAVHESLPYIDPEPTAAERAAAESLIAAELSSSSSSSPPASLLPPLRAPNFSPLVTLELERIAAGAPFAGGVDLSRYEALPDSDSSSSSSELQTSLRLAYAAGTYLASRRAHLRLLDAHGRNAWLLANWRAEADLRALERDLAAARRDVDRLALARRAAQDAAAAELCGLDYAWRRGVARALEAEVAAEDLRRQVRDRQRAAAAAAAAADDDDDGRAVTAS